MRTEIDTEDIRNFAGNKEVNLSDIEAYVSSRVRPDRKPANSALKEGFYVSRDEYVDYVITRRRKLKKKVRRQKRKQSIGGFVAWLVRFVVGSIIFWFVLALFYALIWTAQQSHKEARKIIQQNTIHSSYNHLRGNQTQ